MKHFFLLFILGAINLSSRAQDLKPYVMSYEKATILVVDNDFYSQLRFPGETETHCGFYDRYSSTFYTPDYITIRHVDEDWIEPGSSGCGESIDFDAEKYYGSLALQGVIDTVEWDNLVFYLITDKARIRVKTSEKEIDALYKNFYEESHLGKVKIWLQLVTYDTPRENVMAYNRDEPRFKKIKRIFTKYLEY